MRARGIEGVGATPVHCSAVSRPGLHSGEVIAQSGMAGVHEPGECGKFQREHHLDVRRAELRARHMATARVRLGSYPVPVKARHIAPLAQKGAAFIDGEVAGTPGMVAARKGVVYLAGDAQACKKLEPVVAGFADSCIYLGPFGAASRVS
jgi:hypothetical protein